jgi:hypothetical protein
MYNSESIFKIILIKNRKITSGGFMKLFKRLGFVCLIAVILAMPVASYAIVDASIYGGYSFSGEMSGSGVTDDTKGWLYGFNGHVNTGIPYIFTIGLGGFYQMSPLDVKTSAGTVNSNRTTYGIDVYGQLDLPFIPVNPYVRYGLGINDKIKVDNSGGSNTYSKYFNSSYYGIGLGYSLFDAVLVDVKIFAEYRYTMSKLDSGIKLKGNEIDFGLQVSI